MRLLRRRYMAVRLAMVGSAFVLFLFILQRDVSGREQATEKPWLKSLVSQKDRSHLYFLLNIESWQVLAPIRNTE